MSSMHVILYTVLFTTVFLSFHPIHVASVRLPSFKRVSELKLTPVSSAAERTATVAAMAAQATQLHFLDTDELAEGASVLAEAGLMPALEAGRSAGAADAADALAASLFELDARTQTQAFAAEEEAHEQEEEEEEHHFLEAETETMQTKGIGLNDEDCTVDSDCASGKCANRDSIGRRRACAPKGGWDAGNGCKSKDDCANVLRCATNTGGGSYTYCLLLPMTLADVYELCQNDKQCASGNCGFLDGTKTLKRCIPKGGLPSGMACAADADCAGKSSLLAANLRVAGIANLNNALRLASGDSCKVRSASDKTSYCVGLANNRAADYELCDSDADCLNQNCAPSFTTTRRRCIPRGGMPNGRACNADNDCASKNCDPQDNSKAKYCSAAAKRLLLTGLVKTTAPKAILKLRVAARMCASARENAKLTLRCGTGGGIITGVTFASFGTPTGGCGAVSPLVQRACHDSDSKALVETACLKKSSCTINVKRGQKYGRFEVSDPCVGKTKVFLAKVQCAPLPAGQLASPDDDGDDDATPDDRLTIGTGSCSVTIPPNGVLGDCANLASGGTCSITCNDGYHVEGAAYSCAGSTVSGSQSCVADGCVVPDKPEAGSYSGAGCVVGGDGKVPSGTACALTCDAGYHIAGAPVPPRRCTNGALEGEVQVCEGDNCAAQTDQLENGSQGTCGVTVAAKATCSITCATGYHAEPKDPRTCSAGTLQGTKQVCVGDPCAAPAAAPDNGNLGTCAREVSHSQTCSFACNPGYKLVGDERTCSAGVLGGTTQTCEGLPCVAPTRAVENGGLGACAGEIAHGGSCKFSCDAGYELVGAALECKATLLTDDNMVCKGLPCAPRQTPPENGGLGNCGSQIPHGTTCTFSCKEGYHVVGDPRTCTATTLSGADQRCEGDPCEGLKLVPINGQLGDCGLEIKHDTKCSIACDEGFHVEGEAPSCFAGQLKVQMTPVCIGNPCPALSPLPPNALAGTCGVEIMHGASCSISCPFGFLGRGPNERTCFAGKLEGEPQRCIADPGPDVLAKLDDSLAHIKTINANIDEMKLAQKVEDQKHAAIAAHGAEKNAAEREKLIPLWEKAMREPVVRSYKPIDINNQYTYNRVYMPPETNTDDKVIKKGGDLAKSADALHAVRVEFMQNKCKEKTCDVTADTIKAQEQTSV